MSTEIDKAPADDRDLFPQASLSALSGRRNKPSVAAPGSDAPNHQAIDDDLDGGGRGRERVAPGLDEFDELDAPISKARRGRKPKPSRDQEPRGAELIGTPVSFQVSEGVRRRLDKAQSVALTTNRNRKTHLEFILEALEAGAEEGWDVVVKASVPEIKRGRFGGARTLKDREYAGTGAESLYVRMSEELLEEIDAAYQEANLPDRNKLVAICLNRYLPGRKDRAGVTD
ncbi:hypothetical protein ACFWSF_39075 [Streptomyces sp. NPDC058611]|uniref:hypothetical protein n=1 Tax=unclassified Streptomyces TaxID=2593676 RepID=UPI0036462BE5